MSALQALQQDPGVLALNAMEATIDMSNEEQLCEYVVHGLSIGTQFGDQSEDIRLLTEVINAIANGIKDNNLRERGFSFDASSTPCGICGISGHTFANCELIKDKGKVTKAFTKLVMALKKLLRLVNQNLGTSSSLASQGLSMINALDNSPVPSRNDNMMLHLANSVVHLNSVMSSRSRSHAADDDSASTNDENVNDSINAVQQYSSSGRRSDFRFGQL